MIVAVAGGKGGVGKSTVSVNLARELDAVVVDADLATPDLPSGPGPDLHDVLAGRADPVEAVHQFGRVRCLPCGRSLAGACAATLDRFGRAVDRVEREFGRVVVDCPAGLARDVGVALETADLAVLVTVPEGPALVDAFRTRELALGLDSPIGAVVLNRAETLDHDRIADRVERELAAPTTALGSHDAVATAQSRWRPVRAVHPDCPAVEAFATVAATVERAVTRPPG